MYTLVDFEKFSCFSHYLLVKGRDNYKFIKFLVLKNIDCFDVFSNKSCSVLNTDYYVIKANSDDDLLYFCRYLNKINVEFEEVYLNLYEKASLKFFEKYATATKMNLEITPID